MKNLMFLKVFAWAVAVMAGPAIGQTTKTVYFVRHAEDETAVFPQGNQGEAFLTDCKSFLNHGVREDCCTQVLTPLGTKRAELLAKWFTDKGLLPGITHVLATHKVRTLETVQPVAHAAGLDRDVNGDGIADGTDVDKNPGDGVQQLPEFVDECEDGFEVAHDFYPLVVERLRSLPWGSGIVVAGHSASLYPIMQSLGIDTSNASRFPKNAIGRVNGLNNLWVVTLDASNNGTLASHIRLDFALSERVTP